MAADLGIHRQDVIDSIDGLLELAVKKLKEDGEIHIKNMFKMTIVTIKPQKRKVIVHPRWKKRTVCMARPARKSVKITLLKDWKYICDGDDEVVVSDSD